MRPTRLTPEEQLDWLRLARTEAIGPVTFAHLIARYGGPAEALRALPSLARRGGGHQPPRTPSVTEIQAELRAGAACGAQLLASCEPGYPVGLAVLDAPPPVLWTLGDQRLLSARTVAIVGARIASAAGRRFARELAAALGEAGWVVASGMARGVDAAAHLGALKTGTVAVLAGGVNDVYPPENADLHDSLRRQGCIVSEREIGAGVKAVDFPRRNRIISGLSRGVVVVEAELRSGSLITARLAGEQGREVFAVPGSPMDPRSRGTNDLLRQGATLVEDAQDVLRVLDALPGFSETGPSGADPPGGSDDDEIAPLRAELEGLLSPTPTPINLLARETGAPMSAILAALTELVLAGRAEIAPGNLVVRL